MRPELLGLVTVLAVALGSMAAFALGPARRAHDPHETADRGSFALGGFVRRWFYWVISPILGLSLKLGLTPFFYNLGGVVLAGAGGVAIALGHTAIGGWLILAGGAADSLDGRVARAIGVASPYGAFIDSTFDRFAEVLSLLGIAVLFGGDPTASVIVASALGGSLLVSYTRARGESLGVRCAKGLMQRTERVLLVGLGSILDGSVSAFRSLDRPGGLLIPLLFVIACATLGTAIYRTVWIARRLER